MPAARGLRKTKMSFFTPDSAVDRKVTSKEQTVRLSSRRSLPQRRPVDDVMSVQPALDASQLRRNSSEVCSVKSAVDVKHC
jgi:hypothetical protein